MKTENVSRRHFIGSLGGGVTAAWLSSHWTAIAEAQQHVQHAVAQGSPPALQFFTAAQAEQVEAIAAQIIPTDDGPGAKEAGAVYFIDRALSTFDKDRRAAYTKGLKNLESVSRKLFPRTGKFAALNAEQQIKVLQSIEQSEFFEVVRSHTVVGFLANPSYGGNRDKVGWQWIGFEDKPVFVPPFGYYDRTFRGGES